MDRSTLAARIQEIMRSRPKPAGAGGGEPRLSRCDEEGAFAARCEADAASANVLEVLGGDVVQGPAGQCVVVDRCFDGWRQHGRDPIARYAEAFGECRPALDLLAPGVTRGAVPLFFDLETTGLSGGAGTYAFLVGCGWFEGDLFRTRQFFLRGYGEERALLHAVTSFVRGFPGGTGTPDSLSAVGTGDPAAAAGTRDPLPTAHCPLPTVVTYNGKSFDLPVMDTRFLMHRLVSPFGSLEHLDLLFAARRLWRRRTARDGSDRRALLDGIPPGQSDHASCALTVLEEDILGLRRDADVPGWEIPARYFTYTRTGEARGLEAVFEHNRLDLASLGALTAVVLEMLAGQRAARDRHESLALGRLFDFLGREADAERCYRCAAEGDGLFESALDAAARVEALRWMALRHRRGRRFGEAAAAWAEMLSLPGLAAAIRREALEALAIHHEHRAKDLAAARTYAQGALDLARGTRTAGELQHRLGRLGRKIGTSTRYTPAGHARQPLL